MIRCTNIMLLILPTLLWSSVAAFGTQISGTVKTNSDKPMAFANVFLVNTFEGATTDADGHFYITTKQNGHVRLVCRFIGYTPYETDLAVHKNEPITLNIIMKPEAVEGKTVKVTASAFTASDEEGVTLTSMDVVRTPGAAADLFWAIKTFPGLQQVDEGAGLFVRGGDVNETVMLLDGAVIQHPYKYESPTGGFFGTVNPFLLKGTFFSSGGYSAQYGDALSAALVMESQDMPAQRAMSVGIGLAAESIYLSEPLIDDKLGVAVSGNRSNTKMLFEWNRSKQNFSNYPFSTDLNVGVYYHPAKQTQLKVFMFRQKDNVGVEVDDPDYESYYNGDSDHRFVNLSGKSVLNDHMWIHANVAYSTYERLMTLGVMNLDMNDKLLQSRIALEMALPDAVVLRTGISTYDTRTKIFGTVPENDDDVNPNAPRQSVATDYDQFQTATFAEIDLPMMFGAIVTPGLRGEWTDLKQRYRWAPRLNLSCPITANSHLTAAWGIFYQMPETRYFDPYIGNPDLTSMKAIHYILGFQVDNENRMFRVEGYWKDYQKLLLDDPVKNYTNHGHGYATGMDIFVKDSYGPISGRIAYSWLRSRRLWMDAPAVQSPIFDIPHNLTLVLNFELPGGFSLGSSYRYATGKPYSSTINTYHDTRVPPFKKLDVSLSKIHSLGKQNMLIFYAAFSNLLGRTNIFDYRYSADYLRRAPVESAFGRSFYFGAQVNYN
ncbi:TonB-dependent receptor [candidate division KSB1 bacterium]|nr:TonB-dependent receptor [candidate division KSB1 bacterium]